MTLASNNNSNSAVVPVQQPEDGAQHRAAQMQTGVDPYFSTYTCLLPAQRSRMSILLSHVEEVDDRTQSGCTGELSTHELSSLSVHIPNLPSHRSSGLQVLVQLGLLPMQILQPSLGFLR
jgi:hypothetical protein